MNQGMLKYGEALPSFHAVGVPEEIARAASYHEAWSRRERVLTSIRFT